MRRTLLLLLAVAALARVLFALSKGLILDEFHSWFHATRPTWNSFFATLIEDNHPPFSFLLIGAARRLLGSSELALRTPAIVAGLVELYLVWRIARRLPRTSSAAAAALLAFSTLHLDMSTYARMYAFHALCVTGLVEAVLSLATSPSRLARVQVACFALVGLQNHYTFVQYLGWLVVGVGCAATFSVPLRRALRASAAPLLLALLLSLPWYLTGFVTQLRHGLPPGGDDASLAGLAEAFVHLFFLNVRLGGPFLRILFIAAGVAVPSLAAWGLAGLWRRDRARGPALVLGLVAFAAPLAACVLAMLVPRAGFTWHYLLPSAPAMAVLAGAGLAAGPGLRVRRAVFGASLGSAALLTMLHVRSPGTEDYPGGIRFVLEHLEPGDAVLVAELQPPLFPQGQPWDYYAPRLTDRPPPRLEIDSSFRLGDPGALGRARRVFLVGSALQPGLGLLRTLREGFQSETRHAYGFRPEVHVFSEPRAKR